MIASLKRENNYLKDRVDALEPTKRRKVHKDPNEEFATKADLIDARNKAQAAANSYVDNHGPYLDDEAAEIAELAADDLAERLQ
ncbi:hypothetical protein ACO1O0_001852 [Amphichorda felina]